MQSENTVFVVAPDQALGAELAELLSLYDIRVQAYPSAEHFLPAYHSERTGASTVLISANLPGTSGIALTRQLRAQGFTQSVIVLTESADREQRRRAVDSGATTAIEESVAQAFLLTRLSELHPGFQYTAGAFGGGLELPDGTRVTFRIMHPEDSDIEQRFVRDLSPRSKHLRFFSMLEELPPDMLHHFTHPQYPQTYALIATLQEAGGERQIAVARYEPTGKTGVVEFAIVVADEWQGKGLASKMLRGLMVVAAVAGLQRLEAQVLRHNHGMLGLVRSLGFSTFPCPEDPTVMLVSKYLRQPEDSADARQAG